MSNLRKLSTFRQLSLNCETQNLDNRRKTLRKQFSEDIPDVKNSWADGIGIKRPLSAKDKTNFIDPPPIRIAWEEEDSKFKTEDAVIIKKCNEIKRIPIGRISRRGSLDKDSILNSKQALAERLRKYVKEKEPEQPKQIIVEKEPEKPNLKIFLGSNPKDNNEEFQNHLAQLQDKPPQPPKIIPPLITNKVSTKPFQIRKNVTTKLNLKEIDYSPTKTTKLRPRNLESNAIVVVPIFESDETSPVESTEGNLNKNIDTLLGHEDSQAVASIIMRPSTAAASRREKFQKRTNSAFNATIKESNRVPLVRSSSAPIKPERGKSKLVISKRKAKPAKKVQVKSIDKDDVNDKTSEIGESVKNQKALNRMTAVNGNEVVTMVSLVSPAGSDCDEDTEEIKEKPKPIAKTPAKDDSDIPKHMSLRKAVKTVSFQQSSIHAIRSFSASFPARRASVATAFMLANHSKTSSAVHAPKTQEKRATNSNQPDDDERVPKRRLMNSSNDPSKNESNDRQGDISDLDDGEKPSISVDIKTKEQKTSEEIENHIKSEDVPKEEPPTSNEKDKEDTKTPKEKQCWNLYCKMVEKGVNVSFDTVLRGMLTPTEYRMSKKNFAKDEVKEENSENPS